MGVESNLSNRIGAEVVGPSWVLCVKLLKILAKVDQENRYILGLKIEKTDAIFFNVYIFQFAS